ncbi:MAG: pentapeptide repeat-containing protein [Leptolyngbyaceae cyanobacterium RM1_406_9]|nr:pentapeptide repeat-containing protein [Leptolyngbyaceae cyanobacterium RM1_406_9]
MQLRAIATGAILLILISSCSSQVEPTSQAEQSSNSVQAESQGVSIPSPNADDVERLLTTKECQGRNLTRADLSGANLQGASLQGVDLVGANLTQANLEQTDLTEAYITEANLSQVNLRET